MSGSFLKLQADLETRFFLLRLSIDGYLCYSIVPETANTAELLLSLSITVISLDFRLMTCCNKRSIAVLVAGLLGQDLISCKK